MYLYLWHLHGCSGMLKYFLVKLRKHIEMEWLKALIFRKTWHMQFLSLVYNIFFVNAHLTMYINMKDRPACLQPLHDKDCGVHIWHGVPI